MNSMMALPDDVLNVTIDNIMPMQLNNHISILYNKYISNGPILPKTQDFYKLYADLESYFFHNNISRKSVFNALITLLNLRSTNTIMKYLIDSKCKYDIPTILNVIHCMYNDKHRYKMIYVFNDITSKYIDATHCNSGCINCAKYLPLWWPSLSAKSADLSHIPNRIIKKWNKKTDTYIRDGCCSFECYRDTRPSDLSDPGNTLLQPGQRKSLFCKSPHCGNVITPVQAAAFHVTFCNKDCLEIYREDMRDYYRDMDRYSRWY